ncbi:helix-turn-helix domain-containing protein [Thiomonas sp.]
MSTNTTPEIVLPHLVGVDEAARILGVSKSLLNRDRRTGEAGNVPCIRIAGRALYSPSQLIGWAEAKAQTGIAEAVPRAPEPPAKRGRGRPRKMA